MPLGLNRTDANVDPKGTSYRNGQPVDLATINFGTPVNLPLPGNEIPTSGTEVNTVNWEPAPEHFGNDVT